MKSVVFLPLVVSCLQRAREIVNYYVNDPLHRFNPQWYSPSEVTEKNQKWRQEMLAEKFQRDFAHEMINILTTVPLTPVTALRTVNESPHCWVIFVYNSDDEENLLGIKGVAYSIMQLLFERCGVAMLDMGYPSNQDTFGSVVDETPMILFRKPNVERKMFLRPKTQKAYIKVEELKKWGFPFFKHELDSDIMGVIHQLNALYDKWVEPNYRILATAMDQYSDGRKRHVQKIISNL